MQSDRHLLEIQGLKTHFFTEAGVVKAVDGIDFWLDRGETVGLVGESGSWKTVTALSAMRIVPTPGRIVEGRIGFEGEDLLDKSEAEMARYLGPKMAMIFQDPTSSLNPVFTVESQLTEIIRRHAKVSRGEAREKAIGVLQTVGIPEPETRIREYPHQFSGGMKQRVCIARALALEPTLLFADEPTTNLDVTIQAQVLELMKQLKQKMKMTLVLITHDMGIVADMAEKVTVLYAGRVAETAATHSLYKNPRHPYTEALLGAVPRLDKRKKLEIIPGNIPNLIDPPSGCRFHPRCKYAVDLCKVKVPPLEEAENGHFVACHRWKELSLRAEA